MLSEVQTRLAGASLTDLVVVGFLSDDEVPVRFRPLYSTMYVEFKDVLLKLSTVGDTGRLRIEFADAISRDLRLDDDMVFVASSVSTAILRDPDGANELVSFSVWGSRDFDAELECAAIRFDLANGQQIFFDPSYHFGIRIGGPEQQKTWTRSWPEIESDCTAVNVARS
jgi:hypothetical protein